MKRPILVKNQIPLSIGGNTMYGLYIDPEINISSDVSIWYNGDYAIATFISNKNITIKTPGFVEIMILGGGGNGGGGNYIYVDSYGGFPLDLNFSGGGGGAGELKFINAYLSDKSFSIIVGAANQNSYFDILCASAGGNGLGNRYKNGGYSNGFIGGNGDWDRIARSGGGAGGIENGNNPGTGYSGDGGHGVNLLNIGWNDTSLGIAGGGGGGGSYFPSYSTNPGYGVNGGGNGSKGNEWIGGYAYGTGFPATQYGSGGGGGSFGYASQPSGPGAFGPYPTAGGSGYQGLVKLKWKYKNKNYTMTQEAWDLINGKSNIIVL
jgi:hypothetical protein